MPEELDIVARFHARPGREGDVEAAIHADNIPITATRGVIVGTTPRAARRH
jgi:hypothetical protein